MDTNRFATLFPLGSHLCREPMPAMSELKRDMENLRRHGFNLIKLQEHWAIDESVEGEYDFSRYEELIASPRETLHRLAQFGGLPPSAEWDQDLTGVRFPDQNQTWRTHLTDQEPMLLAAQGETLRSLGYLP